MFFTLNTAADYELEALDHERLPTTWELVMWYFLPFLAPVMLIVSPLVVLVWVIRRVRGGRK